MRKRREAFVPEGHATVAQRFNLGNQCRVTPVPKGRPNVHVVSAVPSGLRFPRIRHPTLKRWAIVEHPSGMKS